MIINFQNINGGEPASKFFFGGGETIKKAVDAKTIAEAERILAEDFRGRRAAGCAAISWEVRRA